MATLTRGVSFRRQGSSGLSWADHWTFTEEGVLVMRKVQDGSDAGKGSKPSNGVAGTAQLQRSRSVGSDGSLGSRKSKSRVIGWLKKTFTAKTEM